MARDRPDRMAVGDGIPPPTMPPWSIHLDPPLPYPQARWCLEIDPRARVVHLGHRVPGTGDLAVQAGAIARSFYEGEPGDTSAARDWLSTPAATALLDTLADGYSCDTLWSGDMVASWSEPAWAAGHDLYLAVGRLLGGTIQVAPPPPGA